MRKKIVALVLGLCLTAVFAFTVYGDGGGGGGTGVARPPVLIGQTSIELSIGE